MASASATKKSADWFAVDKDGLSQILNRRGVHVLILELIQNAWDQDVTRVDVILKPVPGRPLVEVRVEDDDPKGFENLRDSFTLFRETSKRRSPNKRGRFNFGEKAVLCCCTEATVSSTTGTMRFTPEGRVRSRKRTEAGSVFEGTMRMTREAYTAAEAILHSLPAPPVDTYVNGVLLERRDPLASFEARLLTESANDEGQLNRYERNTTVQVYECLEDEEPQLFEMGIPVVGLGEDYPWHVDVQQRCPVNMDRDNVPPSFLRSLNVYLTNEMHTRLDEDDAASTWATDALEDERCSPEATEAILTKRFGEKRVAYDPSDPEANKIAASRGYTVVAGGSLSRAAWQQSKSGGFIKPAGQVTPSPKVLLSPDAPCDAVPMGKWSEGMRRVVEYAEALGERLLGFVLDVGIVSNKGIGASAFYGDRSLRFNLVRLGRRWFERIDRGTNRLLLHEFAHEFSSDHLSSAFHDAIAKLGAKLAEVALEDPDFFTRHGYQA